GPAGAAGVLGRHADHVPAHRLDAPAHLAAVERHRQGALAECGVGVAIGVHALAVVLDLDDLPLAVDAAHHAGAGTGTGALAAVGVLPAGRLRGRDREHCHRE